jgi:hypothetical protein
MTLEERLVLGDVFYPNGSNAGFQLVNPIHE